MMKGDRTSTGGRHGVAYNIVNISIESCKTSRRSFVTAFSWHNRRVHTSYSKLKWVTVTRRDKGTQMYCGETQARGGILLAIRENVCFCP